MASIPVGVSKLYEVQHVIKVEANTAFGCDNVSTTIIIMLYHKVEPTAVAKSAVPQFPILPEDWNGQFCARVTLITPIIEIEPVVYDIHVMPLPRPPAAAAAIATAAVELNYHTVDGLLIAMNISFDQIGALNGWLERNNNSIQAIIGDQLSSIMIIANSAIDQVIIAEMLATAMGSLTCEQVVCIARGAKDIVRIEITSRLAIFVSDKENKALIKVAMSKFQFACVEHLFQEHKLIVV